MTSRPDTDPAAGFTLIEMLAVVAVLGLVLALVAGRAPPRSGAIEAGAAARTVADVLRLARAQAIDRGQAMEVVIDRETRRIAAPDGTVRSLPPAVMIEPFALGEHEPRPHLAIRFAPDGSSTGGSVDLLAGGRRTRISAAWLTGKVSVTDVP